MTTRYFGERITRNEDARLLTGQALFVDDVNLPRMGHAAYVRSLFSHARITSIDTARAREMPGVIAVYTASDLGDYWQHGPLLVSPPPIARCTFNQRTQVVLAKDKVRHLGEALAVVIAESRYAAEDAAAEVYVDYEPLPAVVDLEQALRAAVTVVRPMPSPMKRIRLRARPMSPVRARARFTAARPAACQSSAGAADAHVKSRAAATATRSARARILFAFIFERSVSAPRTHPG